MLSTSSHVYSEILLHLNWHCKNDHPFVTTRVEKPVYDCIMNYCTKCKGVRFLGIGGTRDHLHLVIQVEPNVRLSEWIGKIKGASSHEANRKMGKGTLQ